MTEGRARTPQFLRYAGAGAVGTAVHYSTLVALVQIGIAAPVVGVDRWARSSARWSTTRSTTASRSRAAARTRGAAALRGGRGWPASSLNAPVLAAVLTVLSAHYLVAQVVATLARARLRLSRQPRMDVLSAGHARRGDGARAPVGRRARRTTRRRCCRSSTAGSPRCSTALPAARRDRLRQRRQPRRHDRAAARRCTDADPRVAVIDLSRNFGKEIAMTAGLDHARRRRGRGHRRRPAGPAGADPRDGARRGRQATTSC